MHPTVSTTVLVPFLETSTFRPTIGWMSIQRYVVDLFNSTVKFEELVLSKLDTLHDAFQVFVVWTLYCIITGDLVTLFLTLYAFSKLYYSLESVVNSM